MAALSHGFEIASEPAKRAHVAATPFRHNRSPLDFTTKDTKITKGSEREPANAVTEQRDVEIHEQAELQFRQLQVGQNLRLVEARQRLDRLDLHNHRIGDDNVKPIAGVQLQAFVENWEGNLTLDRNATKAEFVREALLVSRFKKAGPEGPVNLQPRVHDLTRDTIGRARALVPLVSLVVQLLTLPTGGRVQS